MEKNRLDLAILNNFDFEKPPVGVKYSSAPPDSINRLDGKLALCEMLKKAQEGDIFYADPLNHACGAGTYVLGQEDIHEQFLNGQFGASLRIFDSPRAAARLYHYIPTIKRGVVNYVSLAPMDKMQFNPDLLLIFARPDQSEILLRAMSYRTGKMWSSRYSPAIGCAWLFVYPYLSGEINYSITGLGHGMKRRNLFPPGNQIIAIPFDELPVILESLKEMEWEPPAYKPDGLEFVDQVKKDLGLE